jgi:polyferredoxin
MDRVGDARGLIRYATANGLAHGWSRGQLWRRVVRPRTIAYGALLGLAAALFVAGLWTRGPVTLDVSRDRGVMSRLGEDGRIENVYRVQLANRTEQRTRYRLRAEGLPGLAVDGDRLWTLEPGEVHPFTVTVVLAAPPAQAAGPGSHAVRFALEGEDGVVRASEKTTFIVPR